MTRFPLAVVVAVGLASVAQAEPLHTWSYEVYTQFAPNPIIAKGADLSPADVITVPASAIEAALLGHVGEPFPHAATYPGVQYQQVLAATLWVKFANGSPTNSPHMLHTYDSVGWQVTRDWTKTHVGAIPVWTLESETYNGGGPQYGDNYAGWFDEAEGRFGWNRYDVRLERDGSLVLSMTPDVGVNPRHVPEPGTIALAGIGLAGAFAVGRRCKRTTDRNVG